MRTWLALLLCAFFLGVGCEKASCVDCQDKNGTVFTFCDPPEAQLDSLECGDIYERNK